jgi:hypothetical protein
MDFRLARAHSTHMNTTDQTHCQACGSTDAEDVGYDALREGEGYTACCNQRAIYPGDCNTTDCSHD